MQFNEIPTLETERLWLRPFRPDDFPAFAAMWGDPEVMHGLGRQKPCEPHIAWRYLAFLIGQWPLAGCGMWAVEEKETGAFLGRIGYAHPPGWPGFELSWALARPYWGRGFATEGARTALDHAVNVLGRDRVISLILDDNQASIRVAERLGMRLEGRAMADDLECLLYATSR